MRLSGFASGMDINEMVNDLMQAERQPLQRMQQDQQELVLKMQDYREVNREFMQFRNDIFDSVILPSNMDAKSVSSSNEGLVSADASSGATNGTYTISDVTLAASARNFSEGDIRGDAGDYTPDQSISELVDDLEQYRNADGDIEFSMSTFNADGEEVERTFTFDEDASLNEMLNDINSSDLGVQAFYDENSGQVAISRTETGQFNPESNEEDGYAAEIQFGEDDGSNFLRGVLNLDESTEMEEGNQAQNAEFTFNGLEMERTSNNFEIEGVSITLNDEFTEPVTLEVSNDTDHMFDTVMEFVEGYNELIDMVDGKASEEYHRDYAPLTDEMRREMSESEIEMWEERAHSGLLRNDRMLTGALNQMRQDVYGSVNADDPGQAFSHITEIGITTGDYQDGGRLEVDEAALRSAIEQDPQAVSQIFSADGDESEERGIGRRIRDTLDHSIEQIGNRAGRSEMASNQQFTLGREIDQAGDRISNFERRLQQVEERYWNQFTQMEQAMAQANAQAEQMMSQLGGLPGGQQM